MTSVLDDSMGWDLVTHVCVNGLGHFYENSKMIRVTARPLVSTESLHKP